MAFFPIHSDSNHEPNTSSFDLHGSLSQLMANKSQLNDQTNHPIIMPVVILPKAWAMLILHQPLLHRSMPTKTLNCCFSDLFLKIPHPKRIGTEWHPLPTFYHAIEVRHASSFVGGGSCDVSFSSIIWIYEGIFVNLVPNPLPANMDMTPRSNVKKYYDSRWTWCDLVQALLPKPFWLPSPYWPTDSAQVIGQLLANGLKDFGVSDFLSHTVLRVIIPVGVQTFGIGNRLLLFLPWLAFG